MRLTVQEIADLIDAKIEGDSALQITGLSKIEQGEAGTITFLANPKYAPFAYSTGASAIIVQNEFSPEKDIKPTLLRVKDPYSAFTTLLEKLNDSLENKVGLETPHHIGEQVSLGENVYIGAYSYISNGATIGENAKIYPFSFIGENVKIGAGTTIFPNVTVYAGCRIGRECRVHSGSVIGSDGFGFAPQANGDYKKVPQTGIVVLEDHVEIGANCTLDRATLGETVIKQGTKIDNLVQIAHNVEIGAHTVIAAQSGISGSTTLGDNCMVGGQVGIVGHIKLAEGSKIGAQSGVSKSWNTPGQILRGSPAQDIQNQLRSEAVFRQLDQIAKKIHILETKLEDQEK